MGMSLTDRSAIENIVIAQLGVAPASIFNTTSNLLPRVWWVAPGGDDGVDNGYMTSPFLTIKRAIRQAVDNDIILVAPGPYAETIDIGSGDATSGSSSTNGYAKKGLKIIGAGVGVGYGHTGRVQIIGDGSTAAATLKVQSDYMAGFLLKNVEGDTNGVSQPAFHLQTSNSASGSQSNPSLRFTVENIAVRSGDPTVGLLLEGATLGDLRKLHIQGPTIGIGITDSAINKCADLNFEEVDFKDCVTADIATVNSAALPTTTAAISDLVNFQWVKVRHWDRGGTAVTNYVNLQGTGYINFHFFDCWAARDVADATLLQLPANVVWIGNSAAGAEFIIGA